MPEMHITSKVPTHWASMASSPAAVVAPGSTQQVLRAVLVSGDEALVGFSDQMPVHSPAEFVALIEASS